LKACNTLFGELRNKDYWPQNVSIFKLRRIRTKIDINLSESKIDIKLSYSNLN